MKAQGKIGVTRVDQCGAKSVALVDGWTLRQFPGLAVTQSIDIFNRFTVTHLHSGGSLVMGTLSSKAAAERCLRAFGPLTNWDRPFDAIKLDVASDKVLRDSLFEIKRKARMEEI